jgi:hypothetical protein
MGGLHRCTKPLLLNLLSGGCEISFYSSVIQMSLRFGVDRIPPTLGLRASPPRRLYVTLKRGFEEAITSLQHI